MTDAEKISKIKVLLDDGGEMPTDQKLLTYLSMAGTEILSWMYHLIGDVPTDVTTVPTKYENTQIYAVVAGYTHAGAEGENSVTREFRYSDMLDYIHNKVLPYVRVGAVG